MITIENNKLHDLIVMKDKEVEGGRAISREIETIDIKIKRFEEREKKITGKIVPPKELTDRGDEVTKQIMKLSDELDEIARKINDSKLEAIPADMKKEHLELLTKKEKLERDRNKIALKVQKIKDKCVPIIQKTVNPLLPDKFDDIETAKTKDGKVVITTFNYLEDFKKKFNR